MNYLLKISLSICVLFFFTSISYAQQGKADKKVIKTEKQVKKSTKNKSKAKSKNDKVKAKAKWNNGNGKAKSLGKTDLDYNKLADIVEHPGYAQLTNDER